MDDSETETAPSPKNFDRQSDGAQNDDGQGDDGQNDVIIIENTEPSNQRSDNVNTGQKETLEEDSNKENNHKNGQSLEHEMDYDLLIPTNVCHVECEVSHHVSDPHRIEDRSDPYLIEDINKAKIKDLEMQIANDKEMIDKLEEQEVLSENPYSSPYYLCSK